MNWNSWRRYFEANRDAALVVVNDDGVGLNALGRAALARTFAVFQLGEAGEGRIAKEVWDFKSPSIDDDWRSAIADWVREEGRHGRLLGDCARALGGKPLAKNWTNTLLVLGRRALGIHLKLLVVLSAEVIGITFYGLIARSLPHGSIRKALHAIENEEKAHLEFHIEFFRQQNSNGWRRLLFWLAWLGVGSAAGAAVLIDHRRTFFHLGIDRRQAARDFVRLLIGTARAACAPAGTASAVPLARLEARR